MEKRYVLALDQGTTSCRAIVFYEHGGVVAIAQKEFKQWFPQSGWVEHDADEIWRVQLEVAREAVKSIHLEQLAAIGITNQRETAVIWDRTTGKPLHRAIVWQCRRTTELCEEIRKAGWEDRIREKTGLVVDPYFSATKVKWMLDAHPDIRRKAEQGEALFGTVDSWLIWNLTEGKAHVTDYSNASRTMMFNIHTLDWDDDILSMLDIPRAMLPEVKPSSCVYGETKLLGEGVAVPVAAAAGDQQAALFGQACYSPEMAKNTYGTGCFVLKHTGSVPVRSQKGLLTTIAWGLEDGKIEYALEGSVFTAGAVIQWLRDGLELIGHAAETDALAQSVADTEGVYFVPAFTGLGTPYWNPHARGMVTGLTRGARKAHFVRAALESIAYQSLDVLKVMEEESGIHLGELRVDGGASANEFLMQFQAELLGIPVARAKVQETTAQGAAYLAGLAVGFWKTQEELSSLWKLDRVFTPQRDDNYRVEKYAGWKRAVQYQL